MSTFTKNDATTLRGKGNEAFAKEDWTSALQCYTRAIKGLSENQALAKECELNKILSNRSAVYLKTGDATRALTDAETALEMDPSWIKIYHRKSLALVALERIRDAYETYKEAVKINPSSTFIKSMLKKISIAYPLENNSDFMVKYSNLVDIRLRLATLATFWNESSKVERMKILQSLIALITKDDPTSDKVAETMSKYDEDMMKELPMKNYNDVMIPDRWISWYKSIEASEKVKLLGMLWSDLSKTEHQLVTKDMQIFFGAVQRRP